MRARTGLLAAALAFAPRHAADGFARVVASACLRIGARHGRQPAR